MDMDVLREKANHRTCKECGAEFRTDKEKMALEKFCDHIMIHQHTVEQWTNVHENIQASKAQKEQLHRKHSHTCRKCGREWPCNLNAGTDKSPRCHWDNDPDCVKCEAA